MESKTYQFCERYLATASRAERKRMLRAFTLEPRGGDVLEALFSRPAPCPIRAAKRLLESRRIAKALRGRGIEYVTRDGGDLAYLRRSTSGVGMLSVEDFIALMRGHA
jgi:hypothetical protein